MSTLGRLWDRTGHASRAIRRRGFSIWRESWRTATPSRATVRRRSLRASVWGLRGSRSAGFGKTNVPVWRGGSPSSCRPPLPTCRREGRGRRPGRGSTSESSTTSASRSAMWPRRQPPPKTPRLPTGTLTSIILTTRRPRGPSPSWHWRGSGRPGSCAGRCRPTSTISPMGKPPERRLRPLRARPR